ncbi:hypothetical protein HRbin30_01681 [bacterium HR30]|nr:hypothetical protein HRbin30_01681 [bacterium HR30]
MLFVAEYDLRWEDVDNAIAKRLEWSEHMPEGFRFIGEYIWPDHEPAFRGVAIFEADSVEAVNSFVLHYGSTLRMRVHPASDVLSAIASTTGQRVPSKPMHTRRSQKRKKPSS